MHYRRAENAGATYFFTVNLADRSRRLLVEHIDDLRDAVRQVRRDHSFEIIAWVVLPDHLHAIWRLPDGDADYSTRWSLIKARFSRCIPTGEPVRDSRRRKGERGIWQRRFWEHLIRDDQDLRNQVDYIHFNPVKHGDVQRAIDWEYSTFNRYLSLDWVTADWGHEPVVEGDFGEPA